MSCSRAGNHDRLTGCRGTKEERAADRQEQWLLQQVEAAPPCLQPSTAACSDVKCNSLSKKQHDLAKCSALHGLQEVIKKRRNGSWQQTVKDRRALSSKYMKDKTFKKQVPASGRVTLASFVMHHARCRTAAFMQIIHMRNCEALLMSARGLHLPNFCLADLSPLALMCICRWMMRGGRD